MNTRDDLDDPLHDLFGGTPPANPWQKVPQTERAEAIRQAVIAAADHVENCQKCRGTGQWRPGYPCFACKGKGKLSFKTSPEARARGRQNAAARKARSDEERLAAFAKAHKAEHAWMVTTAPAFEFARQMLAAVIKFGDLTPGQMAAVQRCIVREEQRKAEREQRKAAAPAVEAAKLEEAFAKARQAAANDGEGIKWLSLRLDTFRFSDAPANGQWAAAIFVKQGDVKLGRISGGRFHRSFHCDDATEKRVLAAIADPAAAAKAYGQRTGSCSVCGRELTNKDSRELGIGPICAEKYGF